MVESQTLFPIADVDEISRRDGVQPSQVIRGLISSEYIRASRPVEPDQIQPASMDLRLGPVAYRIRASFLPGSSSTVEKRIAEVKISEVDITSPTVFEKGCIYLVPLEEELNLPEKIGARANPKSTTGRLDIFTRLITDYSAEFETVPPGYGGKLYAEVVSRTFTVVLQAGMRLNQIRFVRGGIRWYSGKTLMELDKKESLVYDEDAVGKARIDAGLRISVNLLATDESRIAAYRAKKNTPPLYLGRVGYYDPEDFWDVILAPRTRSIILDPGDFYLLASKEKVRIPAMYAAEMVPFDPSIGEFRIHYAGFFDPGFGYGGSDIPGTAAVLEVRAHEVPILLEHEQEVGRLIYSPMAAAPDKVYGQSIGSSYQQQGLALSKQFKRA
jgi:dCTP deaminase